MARHVFDEEELNRSANRCREEYQRRVEDERRELERDRQRAREREEDRVNGLVGDEGLGSAISRPLKREVRSAVTGMIGQEGYNAYVAASTVVNVFTGMALLVASVAAESSYNNKMMAAQDQFDGYHTDEANRREQEIFDDKKQTLSEYSERVSEARSELESVTASARTEFRETKDEANRAIETASKQYQDTMSSIREEQKASDTRYQQGVEKINEARGQLDNLTQRKLDSAETQYNADVSAAQTRYDREITRINNELPTADRPAAIAAAEAARNSATEAAQTRRETAIADANSRHETAANSLNHQLDGLEKTHQRETENLTSQAREAAQARKDVYDQQTGVIEAARAKMDGQIATQRQDLSNAQTMLDKYQAGMQEKYGTDKNGNLVTPVHEGGERTRARGSDGFAQFVDQVNASHREAGVQLTLNIGTDTEKAALQRVIDDNKTRAALEAKGEGASFVPTASEADKKLAERAVQKYAGDMSSAGGLSATVSNLNKSVRTLEKQQLALNQGIEKGQVLIKSLNEHNIKLNKEIQEISDIKQALRIGKNADGTKLTAEQRQSLSDNLKKLGTVADKKALIEQNKVDIASAKSNLITLKGNLKQVNKAHSIVSSHAKLLNRNGKVILDTINKNKMAFSLAIKGGAGLFGLPGVVTQGKQKFDKLGNKKKVGDSGHSQKAKQLRNKASKVFTSSFGAINRQLNKSLYKGNDFHGELINTARGMAKVGEKFDLAVSVGKNVIKFMVLPASLIAKSGRHTFRLIRGSDKAWAQNFMNTGFGKFLAKRDDKYQLKIAKKKAKEQKKAAKGKRGGTVVSRALSLPFRLINSPQDLAKKLVKGSFTVVGKTASGALKLSKKASRAAYKHTLGKTKFGKALSQRFNLFKDRLASARNFLSNLNPVKAVKKLIGKIVAAILSFLMQVIAYAVAFIICAIAAAASLLFMIFIIIVIASLLLVVLEAIINFFVGLTAQNDTWLKTDPEYLLDLAVDYRNAELEILETIKRAQVNPSGSHSYIPVTKQPLSVASNNLKRWWVNDILNNYSNSYYYDQSISGLLFVGSNADANKLLLEGYNEKAYNYMINTVKKSHDDATNHEFVDGYWLPGENTSNNAKHSLADLPNDIKKYMYHYDSINVSYCFFSDLLHNNNGLSTVNDSNEIPRYQLSSSAAKSNYEISNARDVLAMVDSIYTDDYEKTQKMEVLAYLGVDVGLKSDPTQDTNNLFCNTHKFVYTKGTHQNDIWYHVTKQSGTDNYITDSTQRYVYQNGSYVQKTMNHTTCNNSKLIKFKYIESTARNVYKHTTIGTYAKAAYGEYWITAAARTTTRYSSNSSSYGNANRTYYMSASKDAYSQTYYHSNTAYRSKNGYTYSATISGGVINYIPTSEFSSLCSSYPTRLNFYRCSGTTYYVVDNSGRYMGTFDISGTQNGGHPNVFKQLTSVTINGTLIEGIGVSTSYYGNTMPNMDYFYLIKSGNSYKFRMCYNGNPYTSGYTEAQIRSCFTSYTYFKNSNGDTRTVELYYPSLNPSSSTVNMYCNHVDHVEYDETEHIINYNVCQGHIDLDATVCVATMNNDDRLFFDQAQKIPYQEQDDAEWYEHITYSYDDKYGISGWGAYDIMEYNPKECWKAGSPLINTAKAKAGADVTYTVSRDEAMGSGSNRLTISHTGMGSFKALSERNDKLLFTFAFYNQKYYATFFTSGEQRHIECFEGNSNTKKFIDIVVTGGIPKIVNSPN